MSRDTVVNATYKFTLLYIRGKFLLKAANVLVFELHKTILVELELERFKCISRIT